MAAVAEAEITTGKWKVQMDATCGCIALPTRTVKAGQ